MQSTGLMLSQGKLSKYLFLSKGNQPVYVCVCVCVKKRDVTC